MTLDECFNKTCEKTKELKNNPVIISEKSNFEQFCLNYGHETKSRVYDVLFSYLEFSKQKKDGFFDFDISLTNTIDNTKIKIKNKDYKNEQRKKVADNYYLFTESVEMYYKQLQTVKIQMSYLDISKRADERANKSVATIILKEEESKLFNKESALIMQKMRMARSTREIEKLSAEIDTLQANYEAKNKAIDAEYKAAISAAVSKPADKKIDCEAIMKEIKDKKPLLDEQSKLIKAGDYIAYFNKAAIKSEIVDMCMKGIYASLEAENKSKSDEFFKIIKEQFNDKDLERLIK